MKRELAMLAAVAALMASPAVANLRGVAGGGGGGGTPGGSNTQVQYNNAGAFGGVPNVIYNGSDFRIGLELYGTAGGNPWFYMYNSGVTLAFDEHFAWSANANAAGGAETLLTRSSSGVVLVAGPGAAAGAILTQVVTVANLPAAATAGKGARAFVSDATACTLGTTVVGAGSTACPVYSDGTNWKEGG